MFLLGLGALACGTGSAYGAWQLVWSDEFSQPDGSSPDSSKWGYDIGGNGWGNNELEYYTSRTNNARIQNGQLVIEARQESYSNCTYTSARLLTKGKCSWAYGRMEASIKLPRGQGIWPAFWMLGTNIDSVGWPTCGETDIMENIGNTNDQGKAHGTIHGPQSGGDYNGGGGVGGSYTLPGGAALADSFHLFAVEWTTNQIKWFVDNNQYFTATPASLPSGATWVFTQPQFLILNVAVGGNWPGSPDGTTVFPQQMLVDYVRVYKYVAATNAPAAPTGLTASPGNGSVYLSWNASADASGYNVKRAAVSGGTYTTIGSAASSSFTDTTPSTCSAYYYIVTATNSIGESTNSSEATASLGSFALAVNSGGSATGQFIADAYASGGSSASTANTIDTSGVSAPAPQAVYQTERYGNFTYTFTGLTAGLNYKVRLHFAEIYWSSVGQRTFNVFINGKQVLTNFDIIATAGVANKATIQEFTATPSSGQIAIQYTTVKDNAKSSGIELLLPRTPAPVAGNSGPVFQGTTLNLTASTVAGASYRWTGPNGFTAATQNPSIPHATTNASGLYSVTATVGGCASAPATTAVTVNAPVSLSMQDSKASLTLSWPGGTLQSATNVAGPWSDLGAVPSPYTVSPTNPARFYRVKVQ